MSEQIDFSRLVSKRSTVAGVEPTIPSVETIDETWLTTDLKIGEIFINTKDEKIWYRAETNIVEITTSSYGATVQTTDATPTLLFEIAIPTSVCMSIELNINAMETDDSNGFGYKIVGTFRNDTGTITQVGATTVIYKHTDFTSVDADFSISGTDVQIGLVGEVATVIDWTGSATTTRIETGLI